MTKDNISNPEYQLPNDWRGEIMWKVRELMTKADSEIVEQVKYKTKTNPNGVLVWYKNGMLLTGEVYKQHLRLSFSKGVELKNHDPKGLINSYRAILIKEGEIFDESAFTELINEAVKLNIKK